MRAGVGGIRKKRVSKVLLSRNSIFAWFTLYLNFMYLLCSFASVVGVMLYARNLLKNVCEKDSTKIIHKSL